MPADSRRSTVLPATLRHYPSRVVSLTSQALGFLASVMEDRSITPSGPLPPAPHTPACNLITPLARNGRVSLPRIVPLSQEVIYRLNCTPLFRNVVARRPQRQRAPPKRQEDFIPWSNVALVDKSADPSAIHKVPIDDPHLDQLQLPLIEPTAEPDSLHIPLEESKEFSSAGIASTPLRSPIRSAAFYSPIPLSPDWSIPYATSHPLPMEGQRVRKPAKVAEMCCDNGERNYSITAPWKNYGFPPKSVNLHPMQT